MVNLPHEQAFYYQNRSQGLKKYFLEQKVVNLLQQKWLSKLSGYNYTIVYKQGKENIIADGLSRMYEDNNKDGVQANHEDMVSFQGGGNVKPGSGSSG